MNYQEHESYGHENHDDKFIVVTLDKTPTAAEWNDFRENAPQLDDRFNLDYCDGEHMSDGLEHDWEKTDTCPRGLIGYIFTGNQIRIWASEGTPPEFFMEAVRYTLSETAKTECFAAARIMKISSESVSARYPGNGISMSNARDVVDTVSAAAPVPPPSGRQPGKPPKHGL